MAETPVENRMPVVVLQGDDIQAPWLDRVGIRIVENPRRGPCRRFTCWLWNGSGPEEGETDAEIPVDETEINTWIQMLVTARDEISRRKQQQKDPV